MAFSTFPNNPFPPSTAQFNEGKNDAIQAEIDAIKNGSTIDSFGGVETALATKTNLSNIAPAFDATSGVYAIGDKVIYDGVLYEFTSAHATAGEWDENEVQPVKVSELIDALKSGLTNRVKRFSIGEITGQTLSDFVLGVIDSISSEIGVGECAEVYAIYPNVNYFMFNVLRFEGDNYMFTANNTTVMYYGSVNTSTDVVALYLITATQQ